MLLAKLSPARIAQAYREGISKLPDNFYDEQPPLPQKANPQIKQMPIYDRDAELSSLTLTINAWNSSMERFLPDLQTLPCFRGSQGKIKQFLGKTM